MMIIYRLHAKIWKISCFLLALMMCLVLYTSSVFFCKVYVMNESYIHYFNSEILPSYIKSCACALELYIANYLMIQYVSRYRGHYTIRIPIQRSLYNTRVTIRYVSRYSEYIYVSLNISDNKTKQK